VIQFFLSSVGAVKLYFKLVCSGKCRQISISWLLQPEMSWIHQLYMQFGFWWRLFRLFLKLSINVNQVAFRVEMVTAFCRYCNEIASRPQLGYTSDLHYYNYLNTASQTTLMIHISLTISQGQGYHSFRQYFILSYHFTCFNHFLAVKYVLENLEFFLWSPPPLSEAWQQKAKVKCYISTRQVSVASNMSLTMIPNDTKSKVKLVTMFWRLP